jgi:hypothetical protein
MASPQPPTAAAEFSVVRDELRDNFDDDPEFGIDTKRDPAAKTWSWNVLGTRPTAEEQAAADALVLAYFAAAPPST